jgi:hypothetical protein
MIECGRLKHCSNIDFHGILDEYVGDRDQVERNEVREHKESEADKKHILRTGPSVERNV